MFYLFDFSPFLLLLRSQSNFLFHTWSLGQCFLNQWLSCIPRSFNHVRLKDRRQEIGDKRWEMLKKHLVLCKRRQSNLGQCDAWLIIWSFFAFLKRRASGQSSTEMSGIAKFVSDRDSSNSERNDAEKSEMNAMRRDVPRMKEQPQFRSSHSLRPQLESIWSQHLLRAPDTVWGNNQCLRPELKPSQQTNCQKILTNQSDLHCFRLLAEAGQSQLRKPAPILRPKWDANSGYQSTSIA
jgi:hypothetical protein